jgi:uncharacterized membrane protein YphA (DoxX/SURF4 family)
MRPNPLHDAIAFLTQADWPTPLYWLLLVTSLAIAVRAWRHIPIRHTAREPAIWLLRVLVGTMWWQQSLWKVPPDEGALIYWMHQEVAHAAFAVQSDVVATVALAHVDAFGVAIFALQVGVGASLMLGLFTRAFAACGAVMALNLWLGLYSTPGQWHWSHMFLVILMILFTIDPPGRCLGVDAVLRRRLRAGVFLALAT